MDNTQKYFERQFCFNKWLEDLQDHEKALIVSMLEDYASQQIALLQSQLAKDRKELEKEIELVKACDPRLDVFMEGQEKVWMAFIDKWQPGQINSGLGQALNDKFAKLQADKPSGLPDDIEAWIDDWAEKEREGKDLYYGGYRQVAKYIYSTLRAQLTAAQAEIDRVASSIKTALLLILAKDKILDSPSSGNQDMEHEGRLAGIKKDLEQLIETI